MVTLQDILQGFEKIFGPFFSGIEQLFSFLFNTPTIAGLSIGAWMLAFTVFGIILSGLLS